MSRPKLIELFYEQLIDTPKTPQGLRDGIASLGWSQKNIEPIQDIYSDYCTLHNIPMDHPLLEDYYTVTTEGKAKEKEAEARKRIEEHIAKYQNGGSANDLLDNINKEQQQLRIERNRFSTWADYFNKCKNYDPSKDFNPSMLAGLRFPNGTISYIGARPGGGKSTILVNIAREAIAAKRNAFLINLEMLNSAIITNYTLSLMYANADEKQRKKLTMIEKPMSRFYSLFQKKYNSRESFDLLRHNAMKTVEDLLSKSLFIYDGTGASLETIMWDIKNRASAGDVVLIDYIQRLPTPQNSSDQRYIQIKLISNELLNLAIEKKVVIISGAQFGRPTKDNRGMEATLADFREGGDIEQDAHNALAIEIIADKEENCTERYIHVLKQREGGASFMRATLDCNFNYLYIAGTGKEYKSKKENEKSITKIDNREGWSK